MAELTISGREAATPAQKFAWMLFDWAAQPFFTLITTFVFAPYFAAYIAADPIQGQAIWGWAAGTAGLIIAIFSPIFGAIGDAVGARKPWIAAFSVLAILGSISLYFAVPGGEYAVAIGVVGFILASIGFEFASNFNNAMMPELVSRAELGRLSGSGWALGYAGGIVCLVIVLGFMTANPETGKTVLGLSPIFGLDPATHAGDRATGPFSALWYLIFVAPMFLIVKDVPRRQATSAIVRKSLADLARRLRELPKRRSYLAYLISSMLYRDGLNAVFAFGGIYAAGVLHMTILQVGFFGILATITGTLGAWFGGVLDQKSGPKPVVAWSCVVLILAAITVISVDPATVFFAVPVTDGSDLPLIVFYIAGSVIGAAGGSLQAASRTLLVDQVEPGEVAEAFGLFALAGRATTFIGPYAVGLVTAATLSQRWGVTPLIVLLAAGAIGLIWVRQKQQSR
ncbi:MAG: MFS transporter [Cucumibacter sp.]